MTKQNKMEIIAMLLKLETQGVELNLTKEGFEWYYQLQQEVLGETSEDVQELVG
ncbi:hypothetical protein [Paenibacillus cremeus]|uniref:hypothetical protein n=1 Tax=Paenibacillus cremeus TaxID=2163881 RepID=UPI0016495E7A|nr:hypothetical protein [Paenibacillus cremeus]